MDKEGSVFVQSADLLESAAIDMAEQRQREEVQRIHEFVNSLETEENTHSLESPEKVDAKHFAETVQPFSSLLVDSVEKTVSTLGDLLFDLETKSLDTSDANIASNNTSNSSNQHPPSFLEKDTSAVGTLSVELNSVFRYDVTDAAEGDHYFTIEIDQKVKFQSHIVRNSATPIFNCFTALPIPNFRSLIEVSLWDAHSASKLGSSRVTAYHLMQRNADAYLWKSMGYANNSLPIFDLAGKREMNKR